MPSAPPKPPPPKAAKPKKPSDIPPPPEPKAPPTKVRRFEVVKGRQEHGERVMLYGKGKVGKTTLASLIPDAVWVDFEKGTSSLEVTRVEGVESWRDLRDALSSDVFDDAKSIVIDSITYACDLLAQHIILTGSTEQKPKRSIEDWGYGKGQSLMYEEAMRILGDFDRHVRAGRHVILIAHECAQRVSDPAQTEDFTQYQPRLENHSRGNVRARFKEWVDHLMFIDFDMNVRDGKAEGGDSRTLYISPLPHFWAGSRTLSGQRDLEEGDDSIWKELL